MPATVSAAAGVQASCSGQRAGSGRASDARFMNCTPRWPSPPISWTATRSPARGLANQPPRGRGPARGPSRPLCACRCGDFVGALFLLAFIGCELSIREPLVNLELFSHLRYAAAAVVALIFGAGIYGSSYLVPLFVQTVQGYTPPRAGELLIPGGLILGLVFPIAGRLTDRLPDYLLVAHRTVHLRSLQRAAF